MDWLTLAALGIALALIVVVLAIAGWMAAGKLPPDN
jgi:hypothetical protein